MSEFYHVLPLTPGPLLLWTFVGQTSASLSPCLRTFRKHGRKSLKSCSAWHGSLQVVAAKVWEAAGPCVAGCRKFATMSNGKYYHHRTCTGICWHSTWLCYPLLMILNPSYTIGQAGAEGLRTATVNTGASRMKCRRSLPSASWTPVISSQQHASIADLSGWAFTWAHVSLVACPSHSSQIHLLVLSACLQMQYQQDLNRSIWTPSCSSSRT